MRTAGCLNWIFQRSINERVPMPIPVVGSVPDAQGNLNFKLSSDAAAAVPLLQSQDAAGHANRVNIAAEGLLAAWGSRLVSVDVVEAVASQKLLSGRESMGIGEAIALTQQIMKGAQTTPPVTGKVT